MEEKKFDESKILLYKETGDESIFEEIISNKDIKKYIYSVCHDKMRNYPSSLMGFDDFESQAYLVLWQCIKKYKFRCPICGIQAKTESVYKLHMLTKHNEYREPATSISKYIKFNLGAYLQNELRKEYSEERKSNIMTVSIYSGQNSEEKDETINDRVEFEFCQSNGFEDDVVFKQFLNDLVDKFDSQTKEIFIMMFLENMKQIDIANTLYRQGRYASEQSASVVVSRTIKTKIYPAITEIYSKTNI
ncbi:MAG: hypothetical protein K0Q47_131 [Sedimentibacter sp.]|jgi:hypothetical protein|nr:hypothetical protein [Sedimentibacter sp.]